MLKRIIITLSFLLAFTTLSDSAQKGHGLVGPNRAYGFPGIPGGGTATAPTTGANGYSYIRTLTIDHHKLTGDVNNFYFRVHGTFPWLADTSHGGAVTSSSGYDIIFANGSDCLKKPDWDPVYYDGATGTIDYLVQWAAASASTDSTIYMCYGNASITTPQNPQPWQFSNHKGVYHFGNSDSVLDLNDSASNLDFVAVADPLIGAVADPTMVDGAVSKAPQFRRYNGTDPVKLIYGVNFVTSYSLWSDWSLELVYSLDPPSAGYNTVIASHWGSNVSPPPTPMWILYCDEVSGLTFGINGATAATAGGNKVTEGTPCVSGETRHVMVTHGSDGTLKMYVNGSLMASSITADTELVHGDPQATYTSFGIGGLFGVLSREAFAGLQGWVDEIFVSNVVRSADYDTAAYRSLMDPLLIRFGQPM